MHPVLADLEVLPNLALDARAEPSPLDACAEPSALDARGPRRERGAPAPKAG
ncbi:MAG TPA: hypothetical protein VFV10_08685 [Gammaproteobacteria bacterium]|nr:hypothetical protein [Gammaproteobacteria bacterium]